MNAKKNIYTLPWRYLSTKSTRLDAMCLWNVFIYYSVHSHCTRRVILSGSWEKLFFSLYKNFFYFSFFYISLIFHRAVYVYTLHCDHPIFTSLSLLSFLLSIFLFSSLSLCLFLSTLHLPPFTSAHISGLRGSRNETWLQNKDC